MPSSNAMTATVDDTRVEAWTESTIGAVDRLQITTPTPAILSTSPSALRGTGVTLDIPLDSEGPVHRSLPASATNADAVPDAGLARRREPLRRDSMKRREALLRGKEGSRRRQKWENDHLLGNPWLAPPSPSDYEVRPTHPIRNIPYFLAPLWDERSARRQEQARQEQSRASKERARAGPEVPRALRATLKHSKGAKPMLQDLEQHVRAFVALQQQKERLSSIATDDDDGFDKLESESEDEVVFVGRNGGMRDMQLPRSPKDRKTSDQLIFESPADDRGGTFGRWLVHELATYYDLQAWSVTTGNPARRQAYVGFKPPSQVPIDAHYLANDDGLKRGLPRPLWGLV